MRIIAGTRGSRILKTPDGTDTRPTSDKVKEALFSMLAPYIEEARVLDLFAGSGALSLESLSRGAASAVLVDKDRKAQHAIRENIASLDFFSQAQLLAMDWRDAVRSLSPSNPFSLVFLDPPYRMTDTGDMCARLAEASLLLSGAIVVIEYDRRGEPALSDAFTLLKEKQYRDTCLRLYRYEQEEDS